MSIKLYVEKGSKVCRVFKHCEANKYCVKGKIEINNNFLNLHTWQDD